MQNRTWLALRILLAVELLASLAAVVFGLILVGEERGMLNLRPVGWMFVAAGLAVGSLDGRVLFRGRNALWLRTVVAFPATLVAGWWAVSSPGPMTSGLFASNLAVFWLGFSELRRTPEAQSRSVS